MNKKFQKKKEDFKCENCGFFVEGNGYTNHCPNCLWSKHVDVNPGDRSADCQGLMKPTILEMKKRGEHVIVHSCVKCGHVKKNRRADNDDYEVLLKIGVNK